MKVKLLVFGCLMALACAGKSWAKTPVFDTWRSTETCTADSNVNITTTAVYLYDLVVTSGSAANISTFQYFNSTTSNLAVSRTTSTVYDVDTTGDVFPLGETLSKGFRYTKTGTGCVRIRWNWLTGPETGSESRGYK